MSGNMVSWRDFYGSQGPGFEGFGPQSGQGDVDDLNKALTVGAEQNPPGSAVAGDGFAMRVESLENTLKNTTFRNEHVRLWRMLPKLGATNTVEEHNEISSYGENPDAGWLAEGGLPNEDDSTYERKFAIIKYLGTTRRVTHQATLVKSAHGAMLAREAVNGTMHLLRILERALFYGDSSLSSLQFDGYQKLIEDNSPSANVNDLRGKTISEDNLTDGALQVFDAPNYGNMSHMFLNPKVKADLIKTFFPKERYDAFQKGKNGMVGLNIGGFTSVAGDVLFEADTFINDGGAPTAAIGDATKRPGTPTVSTAATSPTEATAQFIAEDAGDYFYKIQAVNSFGRSAAVDLVAGPTAVTVAAGDKVTWEMTPGGATAVEWYEVFRTKVDGASTATRLILRVPNAGGVGAQEINDLNANLPFTTCAFGFQLNLEAMSFKQLAPLVKVPLATVDTSIRFMLLLYGTPVLYTPGKIYLWKNIGYAPGVSS